MAADPVFVDTNVLVYVSRPTAPEHAAATSVLGQLEAEGGTLWISQQVLREYLPVVTRPQATAPALPLETALADVQRFRASFEVAEDRATVLDHLVQLIRRYQVTGRQIHDANLVATLLDCGIYRLLTFNIGDFRRFADIITLVPLPIANIAVLVAVCFSWRDVLPVIGRAGNLSAKV